MLSFNNTICEHLRSELMPRLSVDDFPYFTNGISWTTIGSSGWDDWVAGFWPGILWMGASVDDRYEHLAKTTTGKVKPRLRNNFNIGFRNQYSSMAACEATGLDSFRKRTERAVDSLLECYHPRIELLGHRRNGDLHVSATDMMANLILLMWAYHRQYRPLRTRLVVERSLSTAMDHFLRSDGSVRHVLTFDGNTGERLATDYPQGCDNGCWSRGLAWMTAGLVVGGLSFRRNDCLDKAREVLSYHRTSIRGSIPPYDYCVNSASEDVPKDTSAAAILASSIFLMNKAGDTRNHREHANHLLTNLLNEYRRDDRSDGLIGGSSFHVPSNAGVNEATIWGDFFTLEALYLRDRKHLPPHLQWLNAA